ncbi:MAG: nitrite reductase small subunit NirD [Pseudomonadota bacterium]
MSVHDAKPTADDAWIAVCASSRLIEGAGVAALVEGTQVALFHLADIEDGVFAVGNYDPIGGANVISRGIVGDVQGEPVVASPLYKQHFSLLDGRCLEDGEQSLPTYPVRVCGDQVWLKRSDIRG